uniref:DIRP domain-containing protein n=1 Tax=Plectus sambesii TaxID=2011161 RepID=A0A914UZW5_9BILA
ADFRGGRRPSPLKRPSLGQTVVVDDDVDSNSSSVQRGRGRPKKENHTAIVNRVWSENDVTPDARPRRQGRAKAGQGATDLSQSLKENLKRLKNVLKLPKARRWVYCEFFYSGVDQQLFLGDNEFSQCLRESFPNVKCRNLSRAEWRTIRRLIGKPRRCSQAFFDEERAALEGKRSKVRQVYEGTLVSMTADMADLPSRLPRPLVVGAKIYARVRSPKDGIYAGTIDAVLPDSYRIVFDKEEMIPAMIIKDSEVMSEQPDELVALAYFLEQNRAAMPNAMMKLGPAAQFISPGKILGAGSDVRSPLLKHDPMVGSAGTVQHKPGSGITPRRTTGVRDEKVGNFP